jgi:hypothetical protein
MDAARRCSPGNECRSPPEPGQRTLPQVAGSVEVACEKFAECLRVAERGAMTAGNLVGDGAQAFLCRPPQLLDCLP